MDHETVHIVLEAVLTTGLLALGWLLVQLLGRLKMIGDHDATLKVHETRITRSELDISRLEAHSYDFAHAARKDGAAS